jgi:hypothetical protein
MQLKNLSQPEASLEGSGSRDWWLRTCLEAPQILLKKAAEEGLEECGVVFLIQEDWSFPLALHWESLTQRFLFGLQVEETARLSSVVIGEIAMPGW